MEVGLLEIAPPANVVPFQSHLRVVCRVERHVNSHLFLDHNSGQASGPFLFDPCGQTPADCSSALQSSRSVLHASILWPLVPSAPEDLAHRSRRNHPCGHHLSAHLWEGGEEGVVALEVVRKEDSCPEKMEAHHFPRRSHFLCQPQTAVVSDHDVEVLC